MEYSRKPTKSIPKENQLKILNKIYQTYLVSTTAWIVLTMIYRSVIELSSLYILVGKGRRGTLVGFCSTGQLNVLFADELVVCIWNIVIYYLMWAIRPPWAECILWSWLFIQSLQLFWSILPCLCVYTCFIGDMYISYYLCMFSPVYSSLK